MLLITLLLFSNNKITPPPPKKETPKHPNHCYVMLTWDKFFTWQQVFLPAGSLIGSGKMGTREDWRKEEGTFIFLILFVVPVRVTWIISFAMVAAAGSVFSFLPYSQNQPCGPHSDPDVPTHQGLSASASRSQSRSSGAGTAGLWTPFIADWVKAPQAQFFSKLLGSETSTFRGVFVSHN